MKVAFLRKALVDNTSYDLCTFVRDRFNVDVGVDEVFDIRKIIDSHLGLVVEELEQQANEIEIEGFDDE